jgi:hypothetical protein
VAPLSIGSKTILSTKFVLLGVSVVVGILLLAGCRGGQGGSSAGTTSPKQTTASTTASAAESTEKESANLAEEVDLAPMNGSGVTGTATFTDVAQGVRVDLSVQGLPDPSASYLTHIHPGSCADEQEGGEEEHDSNHEDRHADHDQAAEHDEGTMAEIEYPLPPISPDPEGRGITTTVLEGVTVERLFSGSPKYINVHAEGSGNPPAIACSPLSN